MAGQPCPYCGGVDRPLRYRIVGTILAILLVGIIPTNACAAVDAEWRFEPLGPEGAAVAEILSPGGAAGLLRTEAGDLYGWIPEAEAWEPVALDWESPVLRMAAAPRMTGDASALILLANGALLRWRDGDRALGGETRPESVAGWVDPEMARSVVAILPVRDGFLLLTRRGAGLHVTPDGQWERWQARFLEPGSAQESRTPDLDDGCGLQLRELFIDPGDAHLILALTEWEGLFLSRDGARNFLPVTNGLPKEVRTLCVLDHGRWCASCTDGFYLSTDGGLSWRPRCATAGPLPDIRQLAAPFRDPEHLLAITRRGQLLSSTDLGETWTRLLCEIPMRCSAVADHPEGALVRIGTSRGVLTSRDGGERWCWENRGLRQVVVYTIASAPQGDELYMGTDLGFYAGPVEGHRWLPNLSYREGCLRTGHPAACPDEEVWRRLSDSIFDLDLCATDQGATILCTAGRDGLARCRILSENREPTYAWSAEGPVRSSSAVLARQEAGLWAAGGEGFDIWAGAVDADGAWNEQPAEACRGGVQPDLSAARIGGRSCVLLAAGGLVNLSDEEQSLSLPVGREALTLVDAGGLLWLGTDAGLYRAADDSDWTLVGFEEERIVSLAAASGHTDFLLAQTDSGVFFSPDGGENWLAVPIPDDLHVTGLGLDPLGRCAYLGTNYGLFAAHPPQITPQQDDRPLPIDVSPNPFATQVQLRCRLPRTIVEDSSGSLDMSNATALPSEGAEGTGLQFRVISVHGQLVRRLSEAELIQAGGGDRYLQWSWDGRNDRDQEVPNGIYLLSTRVGNQAYVGKVIKFR